MTERLELISDTYLSVGTPVQNALGAWFRSKQIIQDEIKSRTQGNRSFLLKHLAGSKSIQPLASEGGWYAILSVPESKSDEAWALELLEKDRVYLHPGYFFDFEEEGRLVVSLLLPPDIFQEGIVRIFNRIEKTSYCASASSTSLIDSRKADGNALF